MSNEPILYHNLETTFTPNGWKEFLWAADRDKDRHKYQSERHARQWEQLLGFIEPALCNAAQIHDRAISTESIIPDLLLFFRNRLRAMNFAKDATNG